MENNNLEKEIREGDRKSLISKSKLFFKIFFGKIKNSEFLNNRIIFWLLIINLLSNLINWIILGVFMNKIDGNVILHYNVYFGVDNIGNWKMTFFMPFIGAVLFFINVFLSMFFFKNKEKIASYILLSGVLMTEINFIIASISVIIINY